MKRVIETVEFVTETMVFRKANIFNHVYIYLFI
jgi:hypothetical protein